MKLLRLALPFLCLIGTTACFGAVDDQGSSRPSASLPSPTSTPTPNVDDPAKPKPTDPPIPARPFGPAAQVKPAPAGCGQPARLPDVNAPDGQQHIWQFANGRAPRSVASGVILGSHSMNELLAVGGGKVAVQTYASTAGADFLFGLVLVDVATGQASEAMPLASGGIRTADTRLGEFALAGYASGRSSAQKVYLHRPPAAPEELAIIQGVDYLRVRLTAHDVLALGGGAIYRVPRAPGIPFRRLGEAEHFTFNDADATAGVYWSKGNAIYRLGSTTPILVLTEATGVLALGFDSVQQKLYVATELGLSRTSADGTAREDILHAVKNTAPGPVANDQWLFPTGKGDIYAHNGRVRAPVNCYDNADLSNVLPYEIDTNTGLGRWMSEDPAYPFVEGTEWAHFDPDTNALYTRR